jgi:hypothetical protein
MAKQLKMMALKPFLFRGRMLATDEELEPDNEAQAKLLSTIGLIGPVAAKRRRGNNRMARVEENRMARVEENRMARVEENCMMEPDHRVVMTTDEEPGV